MALSADDKAGHEAAQLQRSSHSLCNLAGGRREWGGGGGGGRGDGGMKKKDRGEGEWGNEEER